LLRNQVSAKLLIHLLIFRLMNKVSTGDLFVSLP
jgi:hypothetical protein